MSKKTQDTVSGTPVAQNTVSGQVTASGKEWALTVALQKTEWHNLKGITTRFMTLTDPKSGRKFAAIFFASTTDELTADNDSGTLYVNGIDVDDIVAQLHEIAVSEAQ